jgi:hypothetical protein
VRMFFTDFSLNPFRGFPRSFRPSNLSRLF